MVSDTPHWSQWVPYYGLYRAHRARVDRQPSIFDGLEDERKGTLRVYGPHAESPEAQRTHWQRLQLRPARYVAAVAWHAAMIVPPVVVAWQTLEHLVK